MIGKRVPTKDGSFKIAVSTKEMEELQLMPTSDFYAEWMKQVVSEKHEETLVEDDVPLTIYEINEDYDLLHVWETTVNSAYITLEGRTYNIPLDMAVAALQNMDENSETTYKENK
jgi:mevalonate pyrophosphate decarboxylase